MMKSWGLRNTAAIKRMSPFAATANNVKVPIRQLTGEPIRKHFHERRLLKFSNEQLFHVVSNVQSYKQFVPWCQESNVVTKTGNGVEAELVVGFGYFKERYISVVEMDRPCKVIATSKETNLFEYLRTEWRFTPSRADPRKCWVTFEVEFKFKSALYNQAADMFLKEVVNKMVAAFEGQCKKEFPQTPDATAAAKTNRVDGNNNQVALS